MFDFFKRRRREHANSEPFPSEWLAILGRNVPLYNKLPEDDRRELERHIRIFLAEKRFEGCGGLELSDEIRVTIAAHACLLLLHRETDYYPALRSILVYPHGFISKLTEHTSYGVVIESDVARLGESWSHGYVVLSWDDVRSGAADLHDGHNVALHEFAHQLDEEDGSANGAPLMEQRSQYVTWARVLGAAFAELRTATMFGDETVLDTYGATSPAEFFAVATETFFEKPLQLKEKHPELYEELRMFYKQDPTEYMRDEEKYERGTMNDGD
jgi:Mlc titration factor MtfA (ptsG expression regulator)